MTLAGTAAATLVATLTLVGVTGGSPGVWRDDQPRQTTVQPRPAPVLHIGDSVTWGTP